MNTTLSDEVVLKQDVLRRVKTPKVRREQLLDEFERSGLTGQKFAKLAGIKYQTFATWVQRRRRQRGDYAAGKLTAAKKSVQWLEAVMAAPTGAVVPAQGLFLVLHLPGGARVEIGAAKQVELAAARRIARMLGAERHIVLPLDLSAFGGSALTADIDVPKDGVGEGIPVTYVPARNTIFLSLALGWAEAAGARDLFIGVNALDYSGYPDCRPEFIQGFEKLAELATRSGIFVVS